MHIFTDQCINTDVVEELRRFGFKVELASEKGLSKASDQEIFHYVLKHKRVLLTFDKDFGNIIRFNIKACEGTVIVYVEGLTKSEIAKRAAAFFKKATAKILRGGLFIIEPDRVRIWRH